MKQSEINIYPKRKKAHRKNAHAEKRARGKKRIRKKKKRCRKKNADTIILTDHTFVYCGLPVSYNFKYKNVCYLAFLAKEKIQVKQQEYSNKNHQ